MLTIFAVESRLANANVKFIFDNVVLVCRLIDGKYPNYEAVIPKENPNKLTIDRASFLNSVRRVSIFSRFGENVENRAKFIEMILTMV